MKHYKFVFFVNLLCVIGNTCGMEAEDKDEELFELAIGVEGITLRELNTRSRMLHNTQPEEGEKKLDESCEKMSQEELNQDFLAAVIIGNLDDMNLLYEQGAQVQTQDELGQQALRLAVLRGHLAVVDWLVRHAASVHARDNNARQSINFAENGNHEEVVPSLLAHDARDDDRQPPNPVHGDNQLSSTKKWILTGICLGVTGLVLFHSTGPSLRASGLSS